MAPTLVGAIIVFDLDQQCVHRRHDATELMPHATTGT